MEDKNVFCSGCSKTKNAEEFNRSSNGIACSKSRYPHCKECCSLRRYAAKVAASNSGMSKREWIKTTASGIREKQINELFLKFLAEPPQNLKRTINVAWQYSPDTPKTCTLCGFDKKCEDFNKGSGLYGRQNNCRFCCRLKHLARTEVARRRGLTRRKLDKEVQSKEHIKDIMDVYCQMFFDQTGKWPKIAAISSPQPATSTGFCSRRKRVRSAQEEQKYFHPELENVRARRSMAFAGYTNTKPEFLEGFVYIASNPREIGRIKVGKSSDYEDRVRTLNTADSNRGFKIEFAQHSKQALNLEKRVHQALAQWFVPHSDEWFETTVENAKDIIMKLAAAEEIDRQRSK